MIPQGYPRRNRQKGNISVGCLRKYMGGKSIVDSPPKESFGPVDAVLDRPLFAARKEGLQGFYLTADIL